MLLVGGYPGEGRPPTGTAEVYDPDRDAFVSVQSLSEARASHTATTLLPDGRVLIAGGRGSAGASLDSTEIFDPDEDSTEILDLRTDRVISGPRLHEGQYKLDGAVAVLPNGKS
ncbi:MAG: kelch repeat-containing protein [Actinomycetota bacterium]|nr:kelch repeat-containing protein [Actinomycetota bacterium]